VLYQRWKTSDELLRAAVQHRGAVSVVPEPDTGTLRGDFIVLLRRANTLRSDLAALLSGMLGSYYDQTGLSPVRSGTHQLRPRFIEGTPASRGTSQVYSRLDQQGRGLVKSARA
jgi:hypothetical protein